MAVLTVEYDFIQPTELRRTVETKGIRGLFLAGQINGTVALETDPLSGERDLVSVETKVKYEGYLRRDRAQLERSRHRQSQSIPADFWFETAPGLSREVVERLRAFQACFVGQP